MLVSLNNAPKEGLSYCLVSCMGCQSEFLFCFVCDLQVHLQNRIFVRFGRSPASYMMQHFKVTYSHALNDKEIPKQDRRTRKRQRIDERVRNTENYKTDDRVDDPEDHDHWAEHDQFREADFECDVDCNEMGRFNKVDSDDSQSTEEACVDDENLFTPLVIKSAMTDVLTTWKEIERQTYECYIDYITCDLDPNSPPLEACIQLVQMDEDVLTIDDILPTTISEGETLITL